MTKLQTVQSLPDAKAKLATGEQMRQLQADLQTQRQSLSALQPQLEGLTQQIAALPLQVSQLAQAIVPLAEALNAMIPLLESLKRMDERLKAIESVLPRDKNEQLVMLASEARTVMAVKAANAAKDSLTRLTTAFPQDSAGQLLTRASQGSLDALKPSGFFKRLVK